MRHSKFGEMPSSDGDKPNKVDPKGETAVLEPPAEGLPESRGDFKTAEVEQPYEAKKDTLDLNQYDQISDAARQERDVELENQIEDSRETLRRLFGESGSEAADDSGEELILEDSQGQAFASVGDLESQLASVVDREQGEQPSVETLPPSEETLPPDYVGPAQIEDSESALFDTGDLGGAGKLSTFELLQYKTKDDLDLRAVEITAALGQIENDPALNNPDDPEAYNKKKEALAALVKESADYYGLPESLTSGLGSRWLLKKPLASQGAMGLVFEAYDVNLKKPAVLKYLLAPPGESVSKKGLKRFKKEAQLLASLVSPYAVRTYSADWSDEGAWFAMEKVEGKDLQEQLKEKGKFSAEEGIEAALQISLGLQDAMEGGLVHRDIKPANVMYNEKTGNYQLADFGLAKSMKRERAKKDTARTLYEEIRSGKTKVDSLRLDKATSDRLQKFSQFEINEENIAEFNQELKSIGPSIPDRLVDVFYEDKKNWLVKQLVAAGKSGNIDSFFNQDIPDELRERILVLGTQLGNDSKTITRLRGNWDELPLEDIAIEKDLTKIIAELPEMDPSLTREGTMVGTPLYMSPEQLKGEQLDSKTDTWSTGVMFYEMMTGELPFGYAGSMLELQKLILQEEPAKSLGDLRPDLPKEFTNLVHKMMSKNPEDRPEMSDIISTLEDVKARLAGIDVRNKGSMRVDISPEVIQQAKAEQKAKEKPGLFSRFFGGKK